MEAPAEREEATQSAVVSLCVIGYTFKCPACERWTTLTEKPKATVTCEHSLCGESFPFEEYEA